MDWIFGTRRDDLAGIVRNGFRCAGCVNPCPGHFSQIVSLLLFYDCLVCVGCIAFTSSNARDARLLGGFQPQAMKVRAGLACEVCSSVAFVRFGIDGIDNDRMPGGEDLSCAGPNGGIDGIAACLGIAFRGQAFGRLNTGLGLSCEAGGNLRPRGTSNGKQ